MKIDPQASDTSGRRSRAHSNEGSSSLESRTNETRNGQDLSGRFDVELAARLRVLVMRLSRHLRAEASAGITASQLSALGAIDRHGPVCLGDLAIHEGVQPPSMTRIVSSLEDAGLVKRRAGPKDRRVALVETTAEGRRVLQRSRSRKNAYLARKLMALGPSDHVVLAQAAGILEAFLEPTE